MSLAVSSQQPDNGFRFGHDVLFPSTTAGHGDPCPPLLPAEPWAAVSAAIGHFGAQSFMLPPISEVVAPQPPPPPPANGPQVLYNQQSHDPLLVHHHNQRPITSRPTPPPPPQHQQQHQYQHNQTPQPPPTVPGYPPHASGWINPNDLSTGHPVQPRSVNVRIHGDVAKFIADLPDPRPPPPKDLSPLPKRHSIDIVAGDDPIRGFSTDYAGWKAETPAAAAAKDPDAIRWTTWSGEPLRAETEDSATYICQKCGLHWYGARRFEDRSEDGQRKRKLSKMATTEPGQCLKWPDMLQYRWYLQPSEKIDPCIKGKTVQGHVHPGWRTDANERDCCPPGRDRAPQGLECFFDDCYFVDKGGAELRKHLAKKHWTYLHGLITRIRDKSELTDCDRVVAHRAMRAYNGRDNSGKMKVSDPRRAVLSPEQISMTARYEEHAEWIELLDPVVAEVWPAPRKRKRLNSRQD